MASICKKQWGCDLKTIKLQLWSEKFVHRYFVMLPRCPKHGKILVNKAPGMERHDELELLLTADTLRNEGIDSGHTTWIKEQLAQQAFPDLVWKSSENETS